MTNATTSGPPITESNSAESTESPARSKPDIEYDDFGLPVRKPRPRTPLVQSSDSEDESFEDAVATVGSASQERGALPKKTTTNERRTPEKLIVQGNVEPPINGRVSEKAAMLDNFFQGGKTPEKKSEDFIVQGNIEPRINGHVSEKAAALEKAAMLAKAAASAKIAAEKISEKFTAQGNIEPSINGPASERTAMLENAAMLEKAAISAMLAAEQLPEETTIQDQPKITANEPAAEKEKEEEKGKEKKKEEEKEKEIEQEQEKEKEIQCETASEIVSGKKLIADETPETTQRADPSSKRNSAISWNLQSHQVTALSEYSHQQLAPETHKKVEVEKKDDDEDEWQTMPAYAHYDMYDDDNRLVAKENLEELEDMSGYGNLGGAAKGYSRVTMDDDAESQTSLDDNTAYLFKERGNTLYDEDEAARDPLAQIQTTKSLLTEGQRVAYVGLVRLALAQMIAKTTELERTKGTKRIVDILQETTRMWSQKMMVRLYTHMEIDPPEQIMIEQLSEHGVVPADLTPALMQNAPIGR